MNKVRINFCFLITFLIIAIYFFNFYFKVDTVISGDGIEYYEYFKRLFGDDIIKNGEYVKFPIGTTLLQLPFLLIAYLISRLYSINLEGFYAPIFQKAVLSAAIFYCILGLIILYKIIKSRFSDMIASLTCISITFGTLLLYYTTYLASYSHVFGFFTCTLFMYFVMVYEKKYYKIETRKKYFLDILLGTLLGLVCLVRYMNIVIVLTYIFYGVHNIGGFKKRIRVIFSKKLLYQMLPLIFILIIQSIIFSIQVDRLILYSYIGEKFIYLFKPQIYKVLFSAAKGIFIFCPILYLAFIGMFLADNKKNKFYISQILIFIIVTYIIASWCSWELGNCYTERIYCDFLCIFALPLASVLKQAEIVQKIKTDKIFKPLVYIIIVIFVLLNLNWINGVNDGVIDDGFASCFMLRKHIINTIDFIY